MQKYDVPFILDQNKPVEFPDFTIEYLGDRKVNTPKYVHKYFVYSDYKITSGDLDTIVSWSSGAGELSPLEFSVRGKIFSFQPWGINHKHKEISIKVL